MRRPMIEERMTNLARFLTKRTGSKKWCKCINTDTVDIQHPVYDPIAQLSCGDFERGYRELGLDPHGSELPELGLFPYASILTLEGKREVEELNAAIKAMVELRQSQYGKTPPPRKKWGRRTNKRVTRKR